MKEPESFRFSQVNQIFFCNGYAESEQTIIDKLDSLGAGEFVITMAVKIKRPIAYTKKIQQM